MTKKNTFEKLFLHLQTVNRHRYEVMKNCFACGIYTQGLTHDLSKYSPAEFITSVRYFQGDRSPYMKEKELFGFSKGWLHHKGRNMHHWEYWYDMIDGQWIPLPMPYPYIVEMVCDRVAACKVYQKDKYTQRSPLEYYQSRNDKLYIHPETRETLESILQMIADEGEEATFAYLKQKLKEYHSHDR